MYPTQYWELRASDKNQHKLKRVITLYDAQRVLIDCHCQPPYPLYRISSRPVSLSIVRRFSGLYLFYPRSCSFPYCLLHVRVTNGQSSWNRSWKKINLNGTCYCTGKSSYQEFCTGQQDRPKFCSSLKYDRIHPRLFIVSI